MVERMTSSGCLKITVPINPHGMYFPFTPLPSPPTLLLSENMVLNRMYGEGKSRGNCLRWLLNQHVCTVNLNGRDRGTPTGGLTSIGSDIMTEKTV